MNINVASQHQGVLAWNGTAARPVDIRNHIHFAFTFEVTTTLVANAVFTVQAAPPSDADPCVPGVFVNVPELLICRAPEAVAAAATGFTILAGTLAGAKCTATLPCRPDAFIRLVSGSAGTASVLAVVTLSGPK